MVHYRTRYAFLSNYHSTIFLKIDDTTAFGESKPCVYYSRPVDYTEEVTEDAVSTRLGLLYLIEQATSGDDGKWRISDGHHGVLKGSFTKEESEVLGLSAGTSFGKE